MIRHYSIIFFIIGQLFFVNRAISSNFYSGADSLRVKTLNGKNYILHKVAPKETWTLLAKKYNCTIEELQSANNGIEFIKIDQIVNIPIVAKPASVTPTPTPSAVTAPKTVSVASTRTPVLHTVRQGETLFAIARKYNQPVETIKEYNKMTGDGIRADQKLIVNYLESGGNKVISQTETKAVFVEPTLNTSSSSADLSSKPVVKPEKPEPNPAIEAARIENAAREEAVVTKSAEMPIKKDENYFDKPTKSVTTVKKGNGSKSMVQISETGVATFLQDGSTSGNKFFGLHRTAPIGTIVKVTNRMNNASVYVKIVGVLPDTGDNDNLIIKMSQAASSKLNALDTYFQVELSYGLME